MISKTKQSRLAGFRILLAIPTAFALLLMFSFTSLEKTTSLLNNDLLQPVMQQPALSSIVNMLGMQQKPVTKRTIVSTKKFTAAVISTDTTKKMKFTPPIILSDETLRLDEIVVVGYGASPVENSNKDVDPALLKVTKNPEFPGGYSALMKFLSTNMRYPAEAQKKNITGTVFVQFNIRNNGEVKDAKILRGVGKPCDEEALRVVNLMPLWTPGIKDGIAVNTNYCIPIKFQLQKK